MNISGPAAVAKPEMLFYAPGDLTVTHQLQEVTIACSMKFIKISKITKTDSWHKFLHSLEAR